MSRVHLSDWTNETGLRHGAVTTKYIILPTGILSVLSRKFGIVELNWLLNVTMNDISVIYVTAQMCRRLEEEAVPTVGLPTP